MPMTCGERLEAAIRLRRPDRVPVVPYLRKVAGTWAGMTMQDFLFNPEKAESALSQAFLDLGRWDAMYSMYFSNTASVLKSGFYQIRWPGEDMPPDGDLQFFETEIMKEEDYSLLQELGGEKFIEMITSRVHPELTAETIARAQALEARLLREEIERYAAHGVPVFVGGRVFFPFDILVVFRSMERFFLDLYHRPEVVEKAEEALLEWTIARGRAIARSTGIPRVFITAGRSSAAFLHPRMFARFAVPYFKRMLEEFSRDGITPLLLFGSNCTLNLPQMRDFPPASCIISIEDSTDIFEAKRVLGDRQCIMGNVPVTQLIYGRPEEIRDYCKKLIQVVGAGGGFILSNSVEMPPGAKKENVKAMIDAAKTFGATGD